MRNPSHWTGRAGIESDPPRTFGGEPLTEHLPPLAGQRNPFSLLTKDGKPTAALYAFPWDKPGDRGAAVRPPMADPTLRERPTFPRFSGECPPLPAEWRKLTPAERATLQDRPIRYVNPPHEDTEQ